MTSKSVIDDYVDAFDMRTANRRLLDHVSQSKEKAKMSYRDLAKTLGYSERRLKYILSEAQNPILYKDEIQVLSLGSGVGLDEVFGIPDLSAEEIVNREFEARNKSGRILEITDMVPSGTESQGASQTDFMRSVLYLSCIHMCLDKYPQRDAA